MISETGNDEVKQRYLLDSANTLGFLVNHWCYDRLDANAYMSIGEENELPKYSLKLALSMEHGSKTAYTYDRAPTWHE